MATRPRPKLALTSMVFPSHSDPIPEDRSAAIFPRRAHCTGRRTGSGSASYVQEWTTHLLGPGLHCFLG